MNNSTTSAVFERVKKLLALSQSDNTHERDLALARANKLIAEHNIDLALLEATDTTKPEAFDETEVTYGKRMPVESKFIAWLLQSHFRVTIVQGSRWVSGQEVKGTWVNGHHERYRNFIGRKSDAEFAVWLSNYLTEEFRRRWAYYRKSTGASLGDRNTFIYGMYKGLDAKLAEENRALENEKFAQVAAAQAAASAGTYDTANEQTLHVATPTAADLKNRYAVAVRTESESLKAERDRRHPGLGRGRRTSTRVNHSSGALSDGMAHGRTISTSRPLAA